MCGSQGGKRNTVSGITIHVGLEVGLFWLNTQ